VLTERKKGTKKAKNNNVLVFSMQGLSRAPAIIIAYLMEKRRKTFKESITMVKSKRNVNIN